MIEELANDNAGNNFSARTALLNDVSQINPVMIGEKNKNEITVTSIIDRRQNSEKRICLE